MEVRGQEHDIKTPGSSAFGLHSPGVERRKDGNHNGTVVLTCTQTLDHVHHLQRQQSLGQGRSPHPDRVAAATGAAAVAPISVGSNAKPSSFVRYRECLKNHAASIGGNVYDGCGEFMPSGEEGTLEALKCAACDCHRNFHRKEVDGETQFGANPSRTLMLNPLQLPPPLPSPTMLHPHHKYSIHTSPSSAIVASMSNMAFGSGGGGGNESSSEDLNVFQSNADGVPPPPPYVLSKKRFRTKFTQEQKDKMLELAEKVGWRINKQDEEEVQKFCAEYGVKRQVFKVWMHNNKNVKKPPPE
ncbi:hypothetical protein Godav_008993 [Gossypium davidsonii]|uniref:ZF-HD dimerization-type domain-containing protein n=2 Tax=Gossypium TaxID=3633 RepID=A0A7J8SC87_GOSDV|nr:hypothetical protein [Gossypium davidsonii]MBA0659106.1 hypothetical protein [Gossypium klotzschianum]